MILRMLREVRIDPEISVHAINDAINRFVVEVLLPRGLLDEKRYFDSDEDKELMRLQAQIVRETAERWRVSYINDDVCPTCGYYPRPSSDPCPGCGTAPASMPTK